MMNYCVFVYGTLRQGQPNHALLLDRNGGIGRTVDPYPLVIGGPYFTPFLLPLCGMGKNIEGEVYEVNSTMLEALDVLENSPSYYRRVLVDVVLRGEDGHTKSQCWLYMKNYADLELCTLPYLATYPDNARYIPPWNREDNWRTSVKIPDFVVPKQRHKRILVLASLSTATGNSITAIRISDHLRCDGFETFMVDTNDISNIDDLRRLARGRSFAAAVGIHAYRAGRLLVELNVPYMIVLGGTDVNVYGQNEERKKIMINVLTNAKRVIVFDKSMVKACCKNIIQIKNYCVIPPAVRACDLHMTVCDIDMRSFTNTCNKGDLLYILPAGLRPVKDVLFLFDAISKWASKEEANRHIAVLVVGPNLAEEYSSKVVRELQGSACFFLHQAIPIHELHNAFSRADAVLNTSISEGLSNAILEALAIGVPVVARNIPGNASVIRHKSNGLLFDSPEDCVSLLQELATNPSLRLSIVENGKSYAKDFHSVEAERKCFQQAVAEVISQQ